MPWVAIWLPLALIGIGWLVALDADGVLDKVPAVGRMAKSVKRHRRVLGYGALAAGGLALAIWRMRQGDVDESPAETAAKQATEAIERRTEADQAARAAVAAAMTEAEREVRGVESMTRDDVDQIRQHVDAMESAEVDAELAALAAAGNRR